MASMNAHQLTLIAMIVTAVVTFGMAYAVGYLTGREQGRWERYDRRRE